MSAEISKIELADPKYPRALKDIADPPVCLYYQGLILAQENCLAIVGSRQPSAYGKQAGYELAFNLAKAGLTIVSGLAPGIDTETHKGALAANGRTIAVLGTGLDPASFYPKSNLKLAAQIIGANGLVVSEYPAGTHGSKFSFPKRNRIISGLSLGVLIIEGKSKSGTQITARWAKQQGRELMALPGPINTSNAKAPNELIKQGLAKLVENSNDVLALLDLTPANAAKTPAVNQQNQDEALLLKTLKQGPAHVDELIRQTGLPTSKVLSMLSILELAGLIRNLGGGLYAAFND